MQPNEITEVLNRSLSQELLARDLTRLAYVAKDGTPATYRSGHLERHGDRHVHPPKILLIRGRAELDVVEGIPEEYLEMNSSYTAQDSRSCDQPQGGAS